MVYFGPVVRFTPPSPILRNTNEKKMAVTVVLFSVNIFISIENENFLSSLKPV